MNPDPSNLSPERGLRRHLPVFVLAALPVLIALLFATERWRGNQAWEDYKRERIAAGDALGQTSFEVPSVPDDQNFYKTPLLATLGYRDTNRPTPHFQCSWLCVDPKAIGSLAEGKRTRLSVYYDAIRSNPRYSDPPTALEPAADIVRLFNQFPEINELRAASQRPFSQCTGLTNYVNDPIPNFVTIRNFVQGFSMVAKAELDSGDCVGAAKDARVVLKFADALRGNSILVNRMVRVAVIGLYTQIFWEGWADQRWTDKQYQEFQKTFLSINLFEDYDQAFRGEEWRISHLIEEEGISELLNAIQRTPGKSMDFVADLPTRLAYHSWYYQNLISFHRAMNASRKGMDPQNKLYDPSLGKAAVNQIQELVNGPRVSTALLRVAVPSTSRARETCVRQQAYVNQAAIVCALERFRRTQGRYPAALSELTPKFIDKVPSDVIGDRPLHYAVTDQGFRLYSVAMDAQDDGGLPPRDVSSSAQCDWAWIKPTTDL